MLHLRKDFPVLINNPELIYFDSGATTLKPLPVIEAVNNFYNLYTANVNRASYKSANIVSKMYEDTRGKVKEFINAKSIKEIIFTSGATHSLNTIIDGYLEDIIKENDVVLTTFFEHSSMILPLFRLRDNTKCYIEYIPVDTNNKINLNSLEETLEKRQVKAICLSHISNILGVINDIEKIVEIAHRNNVIVILDATQSAPHIEIDVQKLDIDFMVFSSHKMLGPSGLGILYGKETKLLEVRPLIVGGGDNIRYDKDFNVIFKGLPHKLEAGTPPIEQVLGFSSAIDYLSSIGMNNIEKYEKELSEYLILKLKELKNINIINENSESGIVSFSIKDIYSEDAVSYFSKHNINIRGGSHCAKLINNITGNDDYLRISLYFYNTFEEIDKFILIAKDITLEDCIESII